MKRFKNVGLITIKGFRFKVEKLTGINFQTSTTTTTTSIGRFFRFSLFWMIIESKHEYPPPA